MIKNSPPFEDEFTENPRILSAFDPSTHASTNIHDIHVSNLKKVERINHNRLMHSIDYSKQSKSEL